MCDVSENFFTVIVPNLNYTKNEGKEVTCGVTPQVEDGEILKDILVFCRTQRRRRRFWNTSDTRTARISICGILSRFWTTEDFRRQRTGNAVRNRSTLQLRDLQIRGSSEVIQGKKSLMRTDDVPYIMRGCRQVKPEEEKSSEER